MFKASVVFQSYPDKVFTAYTGSVVTEEASETLSTAEIVIRHVPEKLGKLHPYEFVTYRISYYFFIYVPVEGAMTLRQKINTEKTYHFVINTISCKMSRVSGEGRFYDYTIGLMSETKLLEKVQLPNKCFTHDLTSKEDDRLTVFEAAKVLVDLYSPRILLSNGTMAQIYSLPDDNLVPARAKTTKLKDLSMNQPTLRQALTAVMSQIGCIPTMSDRKIGWYDFKADHGSFDLADRNIIGYQSTMAADSYVTSLRSLPDDVLDSDNYVVREVLGFRDPSKAILKQQENLLLNTSLPIYSVKKLEVLYSGKMGGSSILSYGPLGELIGFYLKREGDNLRIIMGIQYWNYNIYSTSQTYSFSCNIYEMEKGDDGNYHRGRLILGPYGDERHFTEDEARLGQQQSSSDLYFFNRQITYLKDFDHWEAELTFTLDGHVNKAYAAWWMANGEGLFTSFTTQQGHHAENSNTSALGDSPVLSRQDITPCVVESGKRKLLDTDFRTMPDRATPEEIAKWYYGTVEYSIGGKQITGFSQTWTESNGWWDSTKTFIENIVNSVFVGNSTNSYLSEGTRKATCDYLGVPSEYRSAMDAYGKIYGNSLVGSFAVVDPSYGIDNYARDLVFSIEYQPMNKLSLRYDKAEDTPLVIEQLDTKENGIVSMDDFSAVESDKCDRLGREIVTFSERLPSLTDAIPVGATDSDGLTVFHREASTHGNYFLVSYTCSKDYIIANYSTAIQTKYRAYQYVDYGSAVERKELYKFYVYLSQGNVNGASKDGASIPGIGHLEIQGGLSLDQIFFARIAGESMPVMDTFYRYAESLANGNKAYRAFANDLSVTSYKNNLVFSEMDPDTASPGLFIDGKEQLGGVVQSWYMWDYDRMDTAEFGVTEFPPVTTENIGDRSYQAPYMEGASSTDQRTIKIVANERQDVSEVIGRTIQLELVPLADGVETTIWLTNAHSFEKGDGSQEFFETTWPEDMELDDVAMPRSGFASLGAVTSLTLGKDGTIGVAKDNLLIVYCPSSSPNDAYAVIGFRRQGTYDLSISMARSQKGWKEKNGVFTPED